MGETTFFQDFLAGEMSKSSTKQILNSNGLSLTL